MTEENKSADPFARLKKKKVAVAKPLGAGGGVSGKVKKGRKISPKFFLVGCGAFLIIFLGLMFAGLYFAITSSNFLQSLGLEVEDVKKILLIFAALFFGLIFFGGFYMFVLNVYRLVTVKAKSKLKYILGLVAGIFIILLTIVTGTLSIQKIKSLGGVKTVNTNLLVLPHIQIANGGEIHVIDETVTNRKIVPIIAPTRIRYQLNKPQFDKSVVPQLGSSVINTVILDCGNEQTIAGDATIFGNAAGGFFNNYCFYTEKGDYDLALTVEYTPRKTGEKETKDFTITTLTVNAEIKLVTEEGTPERNDKLNEIIMGVAPLLVDFKAQLLFSDLGLKNDRIIWDLDGDDQRDMENNANFIYPFGSSKLHTINYKLPEYPGFEDTWFSFDMRIVESELSQCTLKTESIDGNKKWRFTPKFDELVDVAQYSYTIYDTVADTFIARNEKETRDTYNHTFEKGGQYEIQVSYFTPEGEKGSCIPKPLQVGHIGNRVTFETKFRQDETRPFLAVDETTPVQVDEVNNEITVTILPAIISLDIQSIEPDPNADLKVYYDGRQLFGENDDRLFELNIGTLGEKELKFVMTSLSGKEEEQIYTVDITRQPVKAMIEVDPTVGESPLKVTLDASISPLYNEDDEIVYFTWDFGDGETKQNVSQGKVIHDYIYDTDKNSGEFYPKVTVKTKLGYEDSYRLKNPIIVKKTQKEVDISVDSHPTRQSRVGEIVEFSIETDGLIEHIDRAFGDEGVGCDDRSCAQVKKRFTKPGTYDIKVEVQYVDDVPVVSRTKIKVF